MNYTTLISPAKLAPQLDEPAWAILDCRFLLADPAAGRERYLAGHLPGACYAHLDEDLSGPIVPGATGRHPLPTVAHCAQTFSRWGIDDRVQVVAYDDASGAFAGRLWWLLRWLGHERVAVLDGDWRAWVRAGLPTRTGNETRPARTFVPDVRPAMQVSTAELAARLGGPTLHIFDARAAERYRGQNETIDPVAGHIPGAVSAPYTGNLDADGCYLPPAQLRARWLALLGGAAPAEAIMYCGSGVSAVHNLIALAHAGLGEGRLYPGSWSEWIVDPARPVATGD